MDGKHGNEITGPNENQFLTFRLGEEEYGVEILKVQEIKGYSPFTPLPNAPSYVKGVLNLRGAIVPVIDLKTKFSMVESAYDKFTVVIVVTVGSKVFGLVVDAVSDVLDIPRGQIEPAPEFGEVVDASFLAGIAKTGDKLVALLDIDRVLGTEQRQDAVTVN